MKKILSVSLLVLSLVVSGCGGFVEDDVPDYSDTTYRKVVLEGDIAIKVDQSKMSFEENQGAVVCVPTGDFKAQLYFPVDGGDAIKQDNTVTLTGYSCGAYGDATNECENVPLESAYTPRSFEFLEATLAVDQDVSALIGVDEPMDILNFQKDIEYSFMGENSIDVQSTCGGNVATMNVPGVINQLYFPFAGISWMLEVTPGQSEDMQILDSEISGSPTAFYSYDMNYTQSETIVFSLEE
ncbi:MAG: hypothetical protein WCT46_04010 [Candidatus Gracilibacteria bacterium]|jgi:hypothetical protein